MNGDVPSDSKVRSKSLRFRKITEFPSVPHLLQYSSLTLSDNPISSFHGFPDIPTLESLYLDRTEISSFEFVPDLPRLSLISLKETPLARYRTLTIMCLILFGPDLAWINGCRVSEKDIRLANRLRDIVAPYLIKGWILMNTNPVALLNPATRARMTLRLPPVASSSTVSGSREARPHSAESDQTVPFESAKTEPPTERDGFDELAAERIRELRNELAKEVGRKVFRKSYEPNDEKTGGAKKLHASGQIQDGRKSIG
jgi:hypothetical protein